LRRRRSLSWDRAGDADQRRLRGLLRARAHCEHQPENYEACDHCSFCWSDQDESVVPEIVWVAEVSWFAELSISDLPIAHCRTSNSWSFVTSSAASAVESDMARWRPTRRALIRRDLQTHLPRDPVRRIHAVWRTTRRSTQRLPLECSRESHFVNKLSPSRVRVTAAVWRPRQRDCCTSARAHLLVAAQRALATRGTLILRNEDLDPQRSRAEFARAMLEDLRWLGIRWSEGPDCDGPFGPYSQSERRASYLEAWRRLRKGGFLYPCVCTRKTCAGGERSK